MEVDDGAGEALGVHVTDGLGQVRGGLHVIAATGQEVPETFAAMRLVLDHEYRDRRVGHAFY